MRWIRFRYRLLQLHRTLGVSALIFIVIMAISGHLLNRSQLYGLDQIAVTHRALQQLAGLATPQAIQFLNADGSRIIIINNELFLNDHFVDPAIGGVIGALKLGGSIYLASIDSLVEINQGGVIVNSIDSLGGLPGRLERIGVDEHQRLVINCLDGFCIADNDLLDSWSVWDGQQVIWSQSQRGIDVDTERAVARYLGRALSLERLMLEIHSGRLFGGWGVMLADLVAFVLLFGGLSGGYLWLYRIRQKGRGR